MKTSCSSRTGMCCAVQDVLSICKVVFSYLGLTFQELPEDVALTPTNFTSYMSKQADATTKLNEQCEQFKALLRTRKEL